MDQLGRVLVLMSVNHGDSAPSHTALCCVHPKVRKNIKVEFVVEVVMMLKLPLPKLFKCYQLYLMAHKLKHSACLS